MVFVDDGKETELSEAEKTLFGVYLNPKLRIGLKIGNELSDFEFDEEMCAEMENRENMAHADLKLYKCSEENGTYRILEIKTAVLSKSDLSSEVRGFHYFPLPLPLMTSVQFFFSPSIAFVHS